MLGQAHPIDATMERASAALVKAAYFECERFCLRALTAGWRALDLERLARICLPLQECRRLIRQQAADAAASGSVTVLSKSADFPARPTPGFYLAQPPLIAADARRLRELLWSRNIPSLVLTREPMTQARQWPVVAAGERSYRTQVEPPAGVTWTGKGIRRDEMTTPPPVEWFLGAAEALGDAAIATIDPKLPALWRVEDLILALDAFPDHEKLHQHLADACRAALHEPTPTAPRPRRDGPPNSF
jgi:hypothetical protein